MRKLKKKSVAAVLLAMAQLFAVLGFTMIGTAALTVPDHARNDFEITGVHIVSADNPIKHNSSISVEVFWKLPEEVRMGDGDQFVFDLPASANQNAALIPTIAPYSIVFESDDPESPIANGVEIGLLEISGSKAEGYRMITTFNNKLHDADLTALSGKVFFNANLDFAVSEADQTYTLSFMVGAQSTDFTITIPGEDTGEEEPPELLSKIDKSTVGGYDYTNNQITWRLDVNQDAVGIPPSLLTITDTLGPNLTYVPNSMIITQIGSPSTVIYSEPDAIGFSAELQGQGAEVVYNPPSCVLKLPAGARYNVTYKTQAIFADGEIPHSFSNAVTQAIEGYPNVGDSSSVTLSKIRKDDGVYDIVNDEIDWVIHANPNRIANMTGTPTPLSVRDEIGDGHRYKDNTLKLFKVEIAGGETEIIGFDYTVSEDKKTVTVQLPEAAESTYYKLYYSTEITDVSRENYANTARIIQGGTVTGSDGGTVTLRKLTKTSTGYDAVNKTIGWRIEVNQGRKAGFTDLVLEDSIDLGHKLLWDDPATIQDENTIRIYEYTAGGLAEVPRAVWQAWDPAPELSNTLLKIAFPVNNYYRVTYKTKVTASGLGTYANSAVLSVSGVTPWTYEEEYRSQSGGGTGTGRVTRRTLTIYKHDGAGHPLQGVVFELYDNADNALGITLTTGADGRASVGNLPRGIYVLKEISTIDGYVKITNTIVVDLTSEDKTQEITNDPTRLTIHKHDLVEDLSGAVFDLKDAEENGTTVRSGITTGANGRAVIEGVPAGDYWLFETNPPQGYLRLSAPIPVTISNEPTEQGRIVEVSNQPSKLTIYKHYGNVKLKDVEFEIYNSIGEKVGGTYTTDENGLIVIDKLAVGEYTLVETKEPTGYLRLNAPIPFTIDEIEVELDVVNVPVPNDNNRMLTIRKLVSEDMDVGKPFRFELRIDGGAPTLITLAGAKSASAATAYEVTLPIGTPFEVREILNADDRTVFDVLVNGIASQTYSSAVSEHGSTVSFLNRRFVIENSGGDDVTSEIGDADAHQIPTTRDGSVEMALCGGFSLLLSALALYFYKKLRAQ